MDLSQYDVAQLRELVKRASQEMERRQKMTKKSVIDELRKVAESRGFDLHELFQTAEGGKGGRKRSVKYRHPEDQAKTWSGQGRKPKWVQEWLESGKSLDDLRA